MVVVASRLSRTILTITIAWLSCGASRSVTAQAQQMVKPDVGSLCILPHLKLAEAKTGSPDMPPPAETYTMRIDGRNWIPLSTSERVFVTNIPRTARHRVAIQGDGRPWAAFSFTFMSRLTSELCLYQNGYYLWWQLFASRDSFKSCRCEGVKPVPY
jgi:hypothetical protein